LVEIDGWKSPNDCRVSYFSAPSYTPIGQGGRNLAVELKGDVVVSEGFGKVLLALEQIADGVVHGGEFWVKVAQHLGPDLERALE